MRILLRYLERPIIIPPLKTAMYNNAQYGPSNWIHSEFKMPLGWKAWLTKMTMMLLCPFSFSLRSRMNSIRPSVRSSPQHLSVNLGPPSSSCWRREGSHLFQKGSFSGREVVTQKIDSSKTKTGYCSRLLGSLSYCPNALKEYESMNANGYKMRRNITNDRNDW